jgi:hypothetical protein
VQLIELHTPYSFVLLGNIDASAKWDPLFLDRNPVQCDSHQSDLMAWCARAIEEIMEGDHYANRCITVMVIETREVATPACSRPPSPIRLRSCFYVCCDSVRPKERNFRSRNVWVTSTSDLSFKTRATASRQVPQNMPMQVPMCFRVASKSTAAQRQH